MSLSIDRAKQVADTNALFAELQGQYRQFLATAAAEVPEEAAAVDQFRGYVTRLRQHVREAQPRLRNPAANALEEQLRGIYLTATPLERFDMVLILLSDWLAMTKEAATALDALHGAGTWLFDRELAERGATLHTAGAFWPADGTE